MSSIQQIGAMFASFWNAFLLPHPVLGISLGSILIGVFVVKFALSLLFPLLGIGKDIKSNHDRALRRREREERRNKS